MRASKRQQVVDKAGELFSLHGFHPVGIDRIIAEADVARMTLYHHFAGKDDLIKAVLEQRYTFIMESIAAKLDPMPHAAARLKGIFDWYGTWFSSPAFAGCLFERALAEFGATCPKVTDVAVRYRDDLLALMEQLLAEIVPRRRARQLAGVYVMLLSGATADARAIGDSQAAARAWQAAEMLLNESRVAAESTRKARSRRA
ncbi:TetR family transcriptional regulator [Burkholderia sp. AU31652]|uniref:TetR family transcriptional regulator n=2 Tax=Burkholderia cepacia complex TaxID=87882 RepID=A0A6J5J5M5_9BURK|nr:MULTISPECIES: TetR/AcrR family transcriptional regulator [Burkholderia]MBN3734370.1 TetR/AcrR family transcriptional regulator [Burkholderia sp. Tr-20390]MCA8064144.1 TetR/AcrR family transcriptional regulator [Burkholderia sp. AU38729]OXI15347.1 TetR family transcriptional regulator [Burkholderia sp. AU15512]OXI78330.1 TetR family transcriptional regulator [Burkholderia sp. AU31652]CAB3966927.1 TetR family transcriptional regulator [Burkholderia cenocepacia]